MIEDLLDFAKPWLAFAFFLILFVCLARHRVAVWQRRETTRPFRRSRLRALRELEDRRFDLLAKAADRDVTAIVHERNGDVQAAWDERELAARERYEAARIERGTARWSDD